MEAQAQGINITGATAPGNTSFGGIVNIKSNHQMMADEKRAATEANNAPLVQGLVGYIRQRWMTARTAKQMTVETRMLRSVRARRGEYDQEMLAQIAEQGGTQIYMFLTSNKCRAASSWLRDVLLSGANDKPWELKPNPVPEMSPGVLANLMQKATAKIEETLTAGVNPSDEDVKEMMLELKDAAMRQLMTMAKKTTDRMELKMDSQMLAGGWTHAFTQFLDDLTTFPAAILKGPVVRNRSTLKWVPNPQVPNDFMLDVQDVLQLEWERVDPFNIYPAPDVAEIDDGYLIERHQLSRGDLHSLIGVDGYSDAAIRQVLDEYGRGGLREWIYIDTGKQAAEGKSTLGAAQNPSELIDALQFWGSVQGKLLIEWGMSAEEVPDPLEEYPIEGWLIGTWMIKAVINPDPLARKPYYKASYEEIPGVFWGNSVADLARDAQSVCNAAARALVNNMSLASGPQVVYNIDRLPPGENITQLYPWKVWQVNSDPMAGAQPPISFFQPNSQAQELMAIYERFSTLADEYTGIPRYMMGGSAPGGAGRTASGMAQMMGNAAKNIKQVIANIDERVIEPAVSRLFYYNMRYGDDVSLKGDINVIAKGTAGLLEKEAATQRRNEFLQMALNSPVAQNTIGPIGMATLLREAAKALDMNHDDIVPPDEVVKQNIADALQQQAQMTEIETAQKNGNAQAGGTPPAPQGPGAALQDGTPVTNLMRPMQ